LIGISKRLTLSYAITSYSCLYDVKSHFVVEHNSGKNSNLRRYFLYVWNMRSTIWTFWRNFIIYLKYSLRLYYSPAIRGS